MSKCYNGASTKHLNNAEALMSIVECLKDSQVFAGLTTEEISDCLSLAEDNTYRKGDVIFYEHSPGDELYILVSGKVSIKLMLISDEDRMPVHIVTPGDIFGELAVIDSGPRSATAICEEDTTVKILKKSAIDGLSEKNNRVGMIIYRNIARIVSERIRRTNEKLVNNITWGVI
jgi:CRP-like cAMP-binding protein